VPFVNTSEATKQIERDRTERGKFTGKRESREGLSTLINSFHTDVIGVDNDTAMLLANLKKKSPMM